MSIPFAINGHPLDNAALGWRVTRASEWVGGTEFERTNVTRPGRDGSVASRGRGITPVQTIAVVTPYSNLETLRALIYQANTVLTRGPLFPGSAVVEVTGATATQRGGGSDPVMEYVIVLSFPGMWYRGELTTETVVLDAATKTVPLFSGLSGKVEDSLVRLTDVSNPRVTDTAGSWFSYSGTIAAGSFLRFDTTSGRAWTTGDAWVGGTEVPASTLSFASTPYLSITPEIMSNVMTRRGRLTVTSTARGTAAAISVQGRNSFLV